MQTQLYFYSSDYISEVAGLFSLEEIHDGWMTDFLEHFQEEYGEVTVAEGEYQDEYAPLFDVVDKDQLKELVCQMINRTGETSEAYDRFMENFEEDFDALIEESVEGWLEAQECMSDPYKYYGVSRRDFF